LNAVLARAGVASRRKSDELIKAGRVRVNGELGELNTFVESRVVPVGRLDVDTTGALLLTNDGPLAHRLAHPRYGVDKVYEVETWKEPNDEALRRLAEGVQLEDGVTAPARVRRVGAARIELVLHEGRNRQVRRMCEAIGHRVRRLHRSVYAGLAVAELEPGQWRELTPEEVAALRVIPEVRERSPRPGAAARRSR
jgi:23S rRNA pseudouridine2605 synthase